MIRVLAFVDVLLFFLSDEVVVSLFSLVPIGHVGQIFSHDFTLSLLIHRPALAWPFARARVEGRSVSRTTSGGRTGDPGEQEGLLVSVARLSGVSGL